MYQLFDIQIKYFEQMELRIEPLKTDDVSLQELSVFLSKVFPKTTRFNLPFLKWQYASCPDGKMIGTNAYDGDKLVSHFAALPLKMSINGKMYKGAASINVSTDSDYRGQMLFTKLGNATIEYAKQNGFDFMIAVPNANSSHAFLKYFKFDLIAPLTVKVGFGTPSFNDSSAKAFKVWNNELLNWRLQGSEIKKYAADDKFIYSPISFFAKTISKQSIKPNPEYLTKIGFRPLNLFIGLGVYFKGKMYFDIPKFIKRPPFNLVFKDFTGNIPTPSKEDIFLQLIDLDTI